MDVTIKSRGQKIWISPAAIKESEGKGVEIDTTGMLFRGELQGTFISRWTHFMVTTIGWLVFMMWGFKCLMDLYIFFS